LSKEQSKLIIVSEKLKSDPSAKLLIEGHCDERGTEEYNRALGERRALALREALAAAGIDASNVRTISYGKDKPADPGHDESAWSKNRRGEFILCHLKTSL
jgi:peptidoglycan-associated lipoprotein